MIYNSKRVLLIWFFLLTALTGAGYGAAVLTNLIKTPPVQQPYKMAESAQFEIIASSFGILTNEIQISPEGKIERFILVKDTKSYDALRIKFPINYYSWNKFSIRFFPQTDGEITLVLMAPYEENTNGVPFREENLWDAIEVEGGGLQNGDFEEVKGNQPAGWVSKGGVANSGPLPPFSGRYYARTSFNRTLETKFRVKQGSTITITARARSLPAPVDEVMRRILSKTTPAHSSAKKFSRGVNLTHYLELNPEEKIFTPYLRSDFELIKSEGFDHIRIPVAWHYYANPQADYSLNIEIFNKVETLITNAFLNGLNVILCWANFQEFNSDPLKQTNMFFKVWKQISEFYNLYPSNLAFELIDSPPSSIDSKTLNLIYRKTIELIRGQNPERTLFIDAPESSIRFLGNLNLPYEENNLIVCVKMFEPVYFTHQGLTKSGLDLKTMSGVVFPGPPEKPLTPKNFESLTEQIKKWLLNYNKLPADINPCSTNLVEYYLSIAKQWSEYSGRPIYISGFGASASADEKSRANYYSCVRKSLDKSNTGWAIYDWKFEFKYLDSAKNQPITGLHKALFDKK